MTDDQCCFGFFGINDDESQSNKRLEDKEQLELSTGVETNSRNCCICKSENIKYCCPGCGLRTCSLNCVKEHKTLLECDGKRDKTPFVRLTSFDQQTFTSDFFFLDEADTVIDRSSRSMRNIAQTRLELPPWLAKIRLEARMRGTRMKLLPAGFVKRKRNKTMFHNKEKSLHWTIELVFRSDECSDTTIMKDRVSEKRLISDIIKDIIDPTEVITKLEQYNLMKPFRQFGAENLTMFLKVDGRNLFWNVNMADTLLKSLEGKTLVEYPTFIVTTKCNESDYPVMPANSIPMVNEPEVLKKSE